MLWNDQYLIYVNTWYIIWQSDENPFQWCPHSLFWYIGRHTQAVYKCTISRYVKSRKYGPHRGTYKNIAKTAIASLYFQCYNPISYSGHHWGSKQYRLAKMWGGGCRRVISINQSIYFVICTCRHNLHKDNFHLLMYNITGTQLAFEGYNFHIG